MANLVVILVVEEVGGMMRGGAEEAVEVVVMTEAWVEVVAEVDATIVEKRDISLGIALINESLVWFGFFVILLN